MKVVGAIALSATLLVFAAHAAETPTPDGVLILYSNQRPTPAQVVIEDTLQAVVADGLKRPVTFYSEYLDDEWAALEAYGPKEAEFLGEKYERRNIRAIVAVSLPALRFAIQFRDRIAARAPIVVIAVARDRVDRNALPAGVLGDFEDNDPAPTLALALRLHPGATRLVLVRGASDLDRRWDARMRAAAERLGSGVTVEYLSGLPTSEVLEKVGALPQGTIVFTPGYFNDGAGQVTTPRQSIERIAAASAVPVYGAFDSQIGAGIVGGYMTRFEDQAKQAGAIVVRLLSGTAPADIASSSVKRVPIVDWRQLQRWRVDERLLPTDTVVRFREPSMWDKYWREISVGVAIFLFQAGLIAALLFERRSRRRTATALEESQKQMNLAAHAARLSMWIWEVAHDKIWATTQLRRHAGLPKEQPIAFSDVLEAAHPADREDLARAVGTALATGEEFDVEYRLTGPDGEVRWIAARGRTEKGNGQRLLGVALDVTERKLSELRAAQDHRALRHMTRVSTVGQLSAAIAHQLNQPLAAILGNAEAAQKMLEREKVDLVELREICNDIVSEDHRAAEVIRRLGELYKRGDMRTEPLDLNELIRETLDLLRTELLIRHVTPLTALAPALPVIEGGHVQLQQVLLNLILNAVDAMGARDADKRKLAIRTESTGAEVRLLVTDSGTGIAPDNLKTVFDAFWSTKTKGMGIGLAICQSIVVAHHGNITAANNAEGGATFCVTLPIRQLA